jgi:hypothetical protein
VRRFHYDHIGFDAQTFCHFTHKLYCYAFPVDALYAYLTCGSTLASFKPRPSMLS